ncbi:MAG: cupin domain-containing protein [Rhizobiales bacterium]|nr:cupin domain-containing protein [Hyphomicrobiales bacterium]
MFPDDLIFVRPDQREPGPVTRGQVREKAFVNDDIWVGYCDITARDEPGQWHHHANYDSIMYLMSGRCRIEWGDAGKSAIMAAGDFGFFGKGVIHRVQIIDDGRCDYVFVRLGKGESVVAVDNPGPRVRSGPGSDMFPDDLIFVRPDQREPGPVTRGQLREKAFVNDDIWVGYCDVTARDEPGQWHHHANYDSIMYLTSGRCRIEWGEDGQQAIMSSGDFGFFGKGVIHRVQVIDDGRCDYVFVRLGQGESVVPVAGPGKRVRADAA